MSDRVYRVKSGRENTRPVPFAPTRAGHTMHPDGDGGIRLVPIFRGGADEVYRVEIPVTVHDRTEPAMSRIRTKMGAFEAGLARTEKRLRTWGTGLSNAGRTLTRNLTLPIIGAGVAILKMYADFEKSMTKIRALVGAGARQMDMYRKAVLEMGRAFPQGPQELADALYFVTSSGFKGAKALDVLRASAKAAAAGLGSTVEVADAVTSAVNAYGGRILSAERATDVLLATVREGKAEPTELAGSIGRVIAPAEAMGVAFDEVGAAVASLSLTGLDAAEAVTALRGIFTTFLKPTKMAKDALKGLGLSSAELQVGIKRDFMGTMVALREEFGYTAEEAAALSKRPLGDLKAELGSNYEAMGAVIGNVRALNGFLALTGRNVGKNSKIFKELAGAVGDTDKAFRKSKSDPMFQFNKALSNLRTTAIEVAPTLLPIAGKILRVIEGWARAISDIPEEKLERIVKILGVLAIAGPGMRLLGGGMRLGAAGIGLGRRALFGGGAMMMGGGGMMAGGGVGGTMTAGGRALPPGVTQGLFGLRRGRVALPAGPSGIAGQVYGSLGTTVGRAPGQTGRIAGGLGKLARGAGAAARGSIIAAMLAPLMPPLAKALANRTGGTGRAIWENEQQDNRVGMGISDKMLKGNRYALSEYQAASLAAADATEDMSERQFLLEERLRMSKFALDLSTNAMSRQETKLDDLGGELKGNEKAAYDAAIAAGDFGFAQDIMSRALKRSREEVKEFGRNAAGAKVKVESLRDIMSRIDGMSVKARIDLAMIFGGDLEAAARYERDTQLRVESGLGGWNTPLPKKGKGGKDHDYPHTMRVRGPGIASFPIGNITEDITFRPTGSKGGGGVSVTVAEGAVQITGVSGVTPDVVGQIAHELARQIEDSLSNTTEDVA